MKLECADSDINSFFEEEKQRTSTLTKNKDGSLVSRVLPIRIKSSAPSSPRHASSDGSNSVGKDEAQSIELAPLTSPRGRSQSHVPLRRTPSPTVSTSASSFSAKSLSESRSVPTKKLSGNTSSEEEKAHLPDNPNHGIEETEEEKLEKLREQLRSPRKHGSSDERNRQIDNLLTGVQGPHIPPLTKGPFTGLYSGSPQQQTLQAINEEITPRRQSLSNLHSVAEKFINIDYRLKKLEQTINGHTARVNNEIVRLRNINIREKEKENHSICCCCCDWVVSFLDPEDEGEEEEYLENGLEKPFLSAFKEISS